MPRRQIFSSQFITVLTMVGVTVGLGNVWRFPYMMGQFGGSAFLLLYLFFTLAFGIPAMTAEWALGRATRQGTLGAMRIAFGPVFGTAAGVLLLVTVLVAGSYYVVVVGNVIYSTLFSVTQGFSDATMPGFEAGLSNGWLQYVAALVLMLLALLVVYRGLKKGIEAVSRVFVPFFGIVVIYLVFHALSLDGAMARLADFLKPDLAALGPTEIFAALGQSFFSLGLGGTFLLVYGRYLAGDANIPRSALLTGLGDVGSALLAALFIVPTILAFGLQIDQGPGLIFSTLPALFSQMPGGRILGSAFLLALSMMAFLSYVAAIEVIAGSIPDSDQGVVTRKRVIVVVGLLQALLILPIALEPSLIGTLDLIFGSGMQVFGSALALLGLTWGLGRATSLQQIFGTATGRWTRFYFHWLRWTIPVVLLVILVNYVITVL